MVSLGWELAPGTHSLFLRHLMDEVVNPQPHTRRLESKGCRPFPLGCRLVVGLPAIPAGMVLAKTKLEALQPSFSASWLQLWISMRYRVKGRRLEMTVLSLLSTLLSKKGYSVSNSSGSVML